MAKNNDTCIYQSAYAEFCIEYLHPGEWDIAFSIDIKSYGFYGTYEFCMRKDALQETIKQLKNMHSTLSGTCKLNDADSDSYVSFNFEVRDLKVTGQLGGSYNENFITFGFIADQTLTKLLSDKLHDFIAQ